MVVVLVLSAGLSHCALGDDELFIVTSGDGDMVTYHQTSRARRDRKRGPFLQPIRRATAGHVGISMAITVMASIWKRQTI